MCSKTCVKQEVLLVISNKELEMNECGADQRANCCVTVLLRNRIAHLEGIPTKIDLKGQFCNAIGS